MEISYFQFSLLMGSLIAFSTGLITYLSKKDKLSFFWLITNIFTSIWSIGYYLMISTTNKEHAWIFNWLLHIGGILIPILFLNFIFIFLEIEKNKNVKKILKFFYLLAGFFLIINPTRLFIQDVYPKFKFNYVCDAGPLYFIYVIYFWILVLICTVTLVKYLKKSSGIKKKQIKFLIFSEIGFLGGGSVFFLTYNINIPPYPLILFAIYPLIITYTIINHNFFGIKFFANNIYKYSIISIFSFIFFYLATFVQNSLWGNIYKFQAIVLGIFFSILFATLISKITKKAQETGDKIFYNNLNPNKIIKDISIKINNIIKIKDLKILIEEEFSKILNVQGVELVIIKDKEKNKYTKLLKKTKKSSKITLASNLKTKNKSLKKDLIEKNIEIIMTLSLKQKLKGLIMIKSKKNKEPFYKEEINFLTEIQPQISIAIENALFYQKIKDFNKDLKDEVEKKTKKIKKDQIEKLNQISKFSEIGKLTTGILHDISNPLT
ncbi:MAG: hypothetical protein GF347_03320, partial [Candidatus Moranbacteria bacterium]|nr:hypothetical protein [Candidatus Moranbacteria bacterium]